MRNGIILLVSFTLAGCFGTDDHLQMEAEHQVESRLKDPSSSEFKNVFVVRGAKDDNGYEIAHVCGIVDGRNSFAAYTGGIRFVVKQGIGHKTRTFSTITVTLEDTEKRATPESVNTSKRETIFESIHWNSNCVDGKHAASYSGTIWECQACPKQ